MPTPDTFQIFGPARYTPPGGRTFRLLVASASDVYERRILPRPRPYVDGAPCDDTGAKPDTIDLVALFAENGTIPGVTERVYPDYHAAFNREARVEGVGTLYQPGRGEKRVRLMRLQNQQTASERNTELVTLNFIEDKEDERATAGSFTAPSSKLAVPTTVRTFIDTAHALGMGGDLIDSLEGFAGSLERAANSPFDAAADIEARAKRVVGAVKKIEKVMGKAAEAAAYAPLAPAEAFAAATGLKAIEDAAAAQRAALFGERSQQPRTFDRPLSIFEIAKLTGKSPDALIRGNSKLPLFGIPPGVPVWV